MASVTVYKWKIRCTTDTTWEYSWAEAEPTTCPTNTAHTIDSDLTTIVETRQPGSVSIKEESTPTNGKFRAITVPITTPANQTVSVSKYFDIPVTVMSFYVVTSSDHEGDILNMEVAPNTTIGVLSAGITTKAAWVSQNYVVDDEVSYNGKNYKCILDTVSSEDPTNTTYWSHEPLVITMAAVPSAVITGMKLTLTDGGNTDELDHIISLTSTTLTVNACTANSYSAGTTYVQISTRVVEDFEFGPSWRYDFGETKIGGAYIPANTELKVSYTNNSTSGPDKRLRFYGEILY